MTEQADHLHVVPLHDLVDHDTSTTETDCVCGPHLEAVKRTDGSYGWLIVHASLDGREKTETQG